MPKLTPDGLRAVTDIAARNGVSLDAALILLDSLAQGNGFQAQFNHPDLGGMGQWSQGGMIMIGDMFNQGLKYRVDGLCNELSGLLRNQPSIQAQTSTFQAQTQGREGVSLFVEGGRSSGAWWPPELGAPASSGAQNDMRYAFFPGARRLAIQQGGRVRVYDTGDHQLSGFSQQQSGDQSLTFTSQHGVVRVADLPLFGVDAEAHPAAAAGPETPAPPVARSEAPAAPIPAAKAGAVEDILKTIERLADLRQKNILTEEEFAAKKAELLSRL